MNQDGDNKSMGSKEEEEIKGEGGKGAGVEEVGAAKEEADNGGEGKVEAEESNVEQEGGEGKDCSMLV